MNSETHEYINTRTTDWHVLYILFHVEFCSRAYLQSEAAKSEIWARGAQREKGNPTWFNERSNVILGQVPCLGTTC